MTSVFEVLGIDEYLVSVLADCGISSLSDLAELTTSDLVESGSDEEEINELIEALKEYGLEITEDRKKTRGRPKGSKDKKPGSRARRVAGRKNAFRNGRGSKRTDRDKIESFKSFALRQEDIERYGEFYRKALKGDSEELEEDISTTLGIMYGMYKKLLEGFLARGTIDIPIFAIGPDGEVIKDEAGRGVIRALKTPKGTLDFMSDLRRSLGIDAGELLITAKSQGRHRALSDKGVLEEVEDSCAELRAAREKFEKVIGGNK